MNYRIASAAILLGSLACAQDAWAVPVALSTGTPASAGVNPYWLDVLDDHLEDLVAPSSGHLTKGAVALIARNGKVFYHKAFGLRDGNTGGSSTALMTTNTIFDLESMTKPFTATVVMKLVEQGVLSLDEEVGALLPDFNCVYDASNDLICGSALSAPNDDKPDVTIRELLRYSTGLDLDSAITILGDQEPWHNMATQPLTYTPSTKVMYSDISYRLLGHLVEHKTGKTLRQNVKDIILTPLGMVDTDYEPNVTMASKMSRVAGTAASTTRNRYLRGEVQDEQDYWVEYHNPSFLPGSGPTGVGCDGVFATAWDLALFGQMLLNGGQYVAQNGTHTLLSTASVSAMTSVQTKVSGVSFGDPIGDSWSQHLLYTNKGFAWELPDGGSNFNITGHFASTSAYWKTGGAGTFIVIDPTSGFIGILLTNHGLPDGSSFSQDANGRYLWTDYEYMLDEIRPDWFSDLMERSTQPTPIIYPIKPPPPYGSTH